MLVVSRWHDICAGHRVLGHEGKCRHLHGHNYRIHFTVRAKSGEQDDLGRVVDFGVIKSTLCVWLERNWDHKMLLNADDPIIETLFQAGEQFVAVPFNPTAENMAQYLVEVVGPNILRDPKWLREVDLFELVRVRVEETPKCSATYAKISQSFKEWQSDREPEDWEPNIKL